MINFYSNYFLCIIRPIKEIEPRCAEALCRLFPSDPDIDVIAIALKAKKNRKQYSPRSRSRSPIPTSVSSLPLEPPSGTFKRQTSKEALHRSPPSTKHRSSDEPPSSRSRHNYHQPRSPSNLSRHRSDVTLYFIILRLTYLAVAFSTNRIQYRTCKSGVG